MKKCLPGLLSGIKLTPGLEIVEFIKKCLSIEWHFLFTTIPLESFLFVFTCHLIKGW